MNLTSFRLIKLLFRFLSLTSFLAHQLSQISILFNLHSHADFIFPSLKPSVTQLAIVPLASLEEDLLFKSLEDLILRANEHTSPQSYAVVIRRTKKSKLGEKKKWLIFDQDDRIREPCN